MDEIVPSPLRAWESFYVIVGSSAGALTGLQFVVLTLISESGRIRGSADSVSRLRQPQRGPLLRRSVGVGAPEHALAWTAPGRDRGHAVRDRGLSHSIMVMRRAMRQREYRPVLEDWIWHAALPMVAYAALWLGGLLFARSMADALFLAGGSALLLVFIGIHNALDTVMYVMLERDRERNAQRSRPPRPRDHPCRPRPPLPSRRRPRRERKSATSPGRPLRHDRCDAGADRGARRRARRSCKTPPPFGIDTGVPDPEPAPGRPARLDLHATRLRGREGHKPGMDPGIRRDEYRTTIPLPHILDSAAAAGAVPPLVAILIDDGAGASRLDDLANRAWFVDFVGDEVVPLGARPVASVRASRAAR